MLRYLQECSAVKWTHHQSKYISNFLLTHPEYPIVSHNMNEDRDDVLGPAFKKVGNIKGSPQKERWRCTRHLSLRIPELSERDMTSILKALGFKGGNTRAQTISLNEALNCGDAYMKMMKLPDIKQINQGINRK